MDRHLQALERAYRERPDDPQVAADLARARLRAGLAAGALSVLRAFGDALQQERRAAAETLARRLELEFVGLDRIEGREAVYELFTRSPGFSFERDRDRLVVLIPGGAYLEDGDRVERSLLAQGARRADLRRVVLPDFLIDCDARGAGTWVVARDAASAVGARLPTAQEWKKALRGGLFLDGDESGRIPNPEPDRIFPGGSSDPASPWSVYSVTFPPDGVSLEWLQDGPGLWARSFAEYYLAQVPPDVRGAQALPPGYEGRVVARFVYDVRDPEDGP